MADAYTDISQSEYGFEEKVVRVEKHIWLHRFTATSLQDRIATAILFFFYIPKSVEKTPILYIFKSFTFKWNIIFIPSCSKRLYHAQKDLAKAGTKRLGISLSILKEKDDWHCWVENQ